jgi:sulfite exporter TauE/SafE
MSIPEPVFGLMLVAGLAGGLGHCSGMCGPLVVLLTPRQGGARQVVLLHAGRLFSYAVIGGAVAALAALVPILVAVEAARRATQVVAGVALVAGGLAALGLPGLGRAFATLVPAAAVARLGAAVARAGGHFALGLAWGLLPCGLLYTAYAAAAGAGATSGDPLTAWLRGAAVLALFGLGTAPTLVAIGWAATLVPLAWRVALQRLAGLVVAASGLILLVHALAP